MRKKHTDIKCGNTRRNRRKVTKRNRRKVTKRRIKRRKLKNSKKKIIGGRGFIRPPGDPELVGLASIVNIIEAYSNWEKGEHTEIPSVKRPEHKQLHQLIQSLIYYIATPWKKDPRTNTWGPYDSYSEYAQAPTIQSHGGNLFNHSIWCYQWVLKWAKQVERHKQVERPEPDPYNIINVLAGINAEKDHKLVLIAAALHDIGKGGDNEYDMYSPDKYGDQDESSHPDHGLKFLDSIDPTDVNASRTARRFCALRPGQTPPPPCPPYLLRTADDKKEFLDKWNTGKRCYYGINGLNEVTTGSNKIHLKTFLRQTFNLSETSFTCCL